MCTNFRGLSFRVEMAILFAFMWKPIPPAACSWLSRRDSACTGIFARSALSPALSASVIVSARYYLLFLVERHFLLLDLSTFEIRFLGRLLANMVLTYLLAKPQPPCRRNPCLHQVSEPLLSFFLIKHHYGCNSFFKGDQMRKVFASSSLCARNQMPWKNLRIKIDYQSRAFSTILITKKLLQCPIFAKTKCIN